MASSARKITVVSSDGDQFEMDIAAALQSEQLKRMYEDDCVDDKIPLHNVNSKTVEKIIEYCQKHADHEATKADGGASDADITKLKEWDADFVKVEKDMLFDLIMAANYLEIPSLLDLTCQTVADMIKGKTPEEIRKTFNIVNDFTPEEEEQIRRENQWAFE